MGDLLSDLTFALRTLRKEPLVVGVTVISLAIGIGATTSVFGIANALLFPPAAGLGEPESLVSLYTSLDDGDPHGRMSYPDYLDVVSRADALEGVTAAGFDVSTLGEGGAAQLLLTQVVSGNFFDVLGIRPVHGRGFLAEETEVGGAERVVVISHALWEGRFGRDPDALGQAIRLNGHAFTVVGVAPEGLSSRLALLEPDLWIPVGIPGVSPRRSLAELGRRDKRNYQVMGRLRADASLPQLEAQLDVLSRGLHEEHGETWEDAQGRARTLSALSERDSRLKPGARAALATVAAFLLVATGLILLIACSNVGSLLLARAARRRRELAVRVALGASRRRLVAMLLTESLVLGSTGGALGLLLAHVITRAISTVSLPMGLPVLRFDFGLDYRVLAFAALVSVGGSLVLGLAPALRASRPDLAPSLKPLAGAAGVRPGRLGLRSLLVMAQVAGSLVLVAGAALFLRSQQGAMEMDLGFDPARIALTSKRLAPDEYTPEAGLQYVRELTTRLSALPGVEQAQAARGVELTLLGALNSKGEVHPEGAGPNAGAAVTAHSNAVTPGYLRMLKVPLLRGRTLQGGDSAGASPVAVVNQTFARRLWPGEGALGQRFTRRRRTVDTHERGWSTQTFEVVGVTRDGKYLDIDDGPTPYFWTSLYQDYSPHLAILVKGVASAETLVPLLRREVLLAENELSLMPPSTLAAALDLQRLHLRVASTVLGWGGLFGLVLAVVGIYGIVSFTVTERRHELAIRMAIGAQRRQLLQMILRDGLALALGGLGVGFLVLVPLAWLVRSQLFGIGPADPLALGVSAAVMMSAALVASFVPASRATRIDPMRTLRDE